MPKSHNLFINPWILLAFIRHYQNKKSTLIYQLTFVIRSYTTGNR